MKLIAHRRDYATSIGDDRCVVAVYNRTPGCSKRERVGTIVCNRVDEEWQPDLDDIDPVTERIGEADDSCADMEFAHIRNRVLVATYLALEEV